MAAESEKAFGLLSLVSVAIGWLLSVQTIPVLGYAEAGALLPAGLLLSLGFLLPVIVAGWLRPESAFRPENILLLGVFFWLTMDLVQGAFHLWGLPREGITTSLHLTGEFVLALMIGAMLINMPRSLPGETRSALQAGLLFWLVAGLFVLSIAKVLLSCSLSPVCIAQGFFAPRFQAPWQQMNLSGLDTVLHNFTLMGMALPALTVALHRSVGRIDRRVLVAGLLCVIYLLIQVQSGDRRYVGMALAGGLVSWVMLQGRLRWSQLGAMVISALLLIVLMNVMVQWRSGGFARVFETRVLSPMEAQQPLVKVDTNFRFLGHVVQAVPEYYPYSGWQGVYATLAAPIPRALLPDKPKTHDFPLRLFVPNLVRGPAWSWTCTAVCDLYRIGGAVAVALGGLLFGLAAAGLYRYWLLRPGLQRAVLVSFATMGLFVGLRALREIAILGLVWVALFVLLRIAQRLSKQLQSTAVGEVAR